LFSFDMFCSPQNRCGPGLGSSLSLKLVKLFSAWLALPSWLFQYLWLAPDGCLHASWLGLCIWLSLRVVANKSAE
jgi:hypothetical protein